MHPVEREIWFILQYKPAGMRLQHSPNRLQKILLLDSLLVWSILYLFHFLSIFSFFRILHLRLKYKGSILYKK